MATAGSLAGRVGGALARLLPSMRRTARQVESYAALWRAANAAATGRDGPLWIVLGDSAAQGVGASAYDKGWVGLVRDRLPDASTWRLVNLSRSGARTRDVLDSQLPELRRLGLEPDLLVVVVGGNDLTHTDLEPWLADLRELLAALPAGTVVATTPRGWREAKARVGNELIRSEAAARGLIVADLWAHTGPPYRGRYADGFHPNDRGYLQWADAITPAVLQRLAREPG